MIICIDCGAKPATMFCKQCEANRCYSCDKKHHSDLKLASHQTIVIQYSNKQYHQPQPNNNKFYHKHTQSNLHKINHTHHNHTQTQQQQQQQQQQQSDLESNADVYGMNGQEEADKAVQFKEIEQQLRFREIEKHKGIFDQFSGLLSELKSMKINQNDQKHDGQFQQLKSQIREVFDDKDKQIRYVQLFQQDQQNQIQEQQYKELQQQQQQTRQSQLQYKELYLKEKDKNQELQVRLQQLQKNQQDVLDDQRRKYQKANKQDMETIREYEQKITDLQIKVRELQQQKLYLEQNLEDQKIEFENKVRYQQKMISDMSYQQQDQKKQQLKYGDLINNFKDCVDSFNKEKTLIVNENKKLTQELNQLRLMDLKSAYKRG